MPVINLSEWDTTGKLSPYKKSAIEQSAPYIVDAINKMGQQNKDKQYRAAIKKEMGIDVPQGVDAAKLYETIMTEKAKAQAKPSIFNRPDLLSGSGGMPGLKLKTVDESGQATFEPRLTPEEAAIASKEKIEASPFYQEKKAKRTEDLLSTLGQNKVQREMIASAQEATPRIPTGLGGKLQMWWNKMFDPNNPSMADWQKVKMVLTDAQLLNTAKTKGAISDQEMALFSRAAANDDIASISAMGPVFNKLLRFIETDENAKIGTFGKLYGEDVNQWPEVQERGQQQKVGKYTLIQ